MPLHTFSKSCLGLDANYIYWLSSILQFSDITERDWIFFLSEWGRWLLIYDNVFKQPITFHWLLLIQCDVFYHISVEFVIFLISGFFALFQIFWIQDIWLLSSDNTFSLQILLSSILMPRIYMFCFIKSLEIQYSELLMRRPHDFSIASPHLCSYNLSLWFISHLHCLLDKH